MTLVLRGFAVIAVGLAGAVAPVWAASGYNAAEANKTCLERYNTEKDGGTIPAGMPKSKYMSQCTNSMKRNAKLEQELAEQAASANDGNELTATPKVSDTTVRTNKPIAVTTPAFAPPKGN